MTGSASVIRNDKTTPLKVKDEIYLNDVVQTGANSALGITFIDATTFNLKASTKITIDNYVYEDGGKSNAAIFDVAKGTAAFIAASVAKTGDMKITTPTATLGIRGTTGLVEVPEGAAANNPNNVAVKLYPDADGRVGRIEVNDRAGARLGFLTQGASGFTIRPGAGGARFAAVPLAIPQAVMLRDQGFVRQLHSTQNVGRQLVFQQREFRRANPGFVNPNRPIRQLQPGQQRPNGLPGQVRPGQQQQPGQLNRPGQTRQNGLPGQPGQPPLPTVPNRQGQQQPGQLNRPGQPQQPGSAARRTAATRLAQSTRRATAGRTTVTPRFAGTARTAAACGTAAAIRSAAARPAATRRPTAADQCRRSPARRWHGRDCRTGSACPGRSACPDCSACPVFRARPPFSVRDCPPRRGGLHPRRNAASRRQRNCGSGVPGRGAPRSGAPQSRGPPSPARPRVPVLRRIAGAPHRARDTS